MPPRDSAFWAKSLRGQSNVTDEKNELCKTANKFSKTTILQFVLIFVKFVLHPCLHLYLYVSYLGSYFYVSLSLAGAPNDGFLLNALKSLFYKGVSVLFPKLLYAIERFTKVRIFLISLSITLLNSKILGFLLSTKTSLT